MKLSSLFLLLGFCFVELITGLDYWNENDYYYIKTGEAAMSNPLLVNLTLIQSDAAKGAVCLVGTLPGYHLDRGFGSGANSWLVNLDVVDVAFAEDQHQITLLISLLLNKDSSIKNVSLQ